MINYIIKVSIYILSICISMYGLNCINFEKYIKKGKVTEFHVLYIILSLILGYLLASFILDFTLLSLTRY